MTNMNTVIAKIAELPADWHKSGSVSQNVLEVILKHATAINPILNTAETGSGKTTLLFSHISSNHLVFALNNWDSISVVKDSDLFGKDNVSFIEGPTQKTLPLFNFNSEFDIVLLDGPHGYPFPDLEYYYFYPRIKSGGLLLLDDVHIPSIKRMLSILKVDDMWELLEIVDNFAVLKRTNAPLLDPLSDSWWLQQYNKSLFNNMQKKQKLKSLLPQSVINIIPPILKRIFSKLFGSE